MSIAPEELGYLADLGDLWTTLYNKLKECDQTSINVQQLLNWMIKEEDKLDPIL